MAQIEFTDNYEDLSTQSGYQFKFVCEKCGNGYMSSWKASKTGMAGGLLGGRAPCWGAFWAARRRGPTNCGIYVGGGPAHDNALKEAVAEIRPLFVQCRRCGQWVCRDICWNDDRGLCTSCAPVAEREIGALQAQFTVEQAEVKLREQDLTAGLNLASSAVVLCPSCGVENDGGKFCSECGGSLLPRSECRRVRGTEFKAGAPSFCPESGRRPPDSSCRFSAGGRYGEAEWVFDESSLLVAPEGGSPLAFSVREMTGIAGDGYSIPARPSRRGRRN